jgi:hypothetical protein
MINAECKMQNKEAFAPLRFLGLLLFQQVLMGAKWGGHQSARV